MTGEKVFAKARPSRPGPSNPIWGFAGKYGGNVTGGTSHYVVTTLADSASPTSGMLRHAMQSAGNHVVFAEGLNGNINLNGLALNIAGNTTVDAGYNSIRIINGRTLCQSPNVILRNLGFYHGGQVSQGSSDDSLTILTDRVLVDRCNIGFAVDECLDAIGSGITIQRCNIGWAVCRAHPSFVSSGVEHGLAARFDAKQTNGSGGISVIGNSFSFCNFRPHCLGDVNLDNNVFYGYGNSPANGGAGPGYSYPVFLFQSTTEGQTRVDLRNNKFIESANANGIERTLKIDSDNGTNVVWWNSNNVWLPLVGSSRAITAVIDSGMASASGTANFVSIQNDSTDYDLVAPAASVGPLTPDNFSLSIRRHIAYRTGVLVQTDPAEVIPNGLAGL